MKRCKGWGESRRRVSWKRLNHEVTKSRSGVPPTERPEVPNPVRLGNEKQIERMPLAQSDAEIGTTASCSS